MNPKYEIYIYESQYLAYQLIYGNVVLHTNVWYMYEVAKTQKL